MNPEADLERVLQPRVQEGRCAHRFYNPQPDTHCPLGVVLVRHWITKVDQQAIAEIFREMPVKAADHLGTQLLISADYLAALRDRVGWRGRWSLPGHRTSRSTAGAQLRAQQDGT